MAAPTTIDALPDDMLHEIFGRVFAGEPWLSLSTNRPPEGAHLALRSVCRRWRDIADWARLATTNIVVDTALLADAGAVRVRHPTAVKRLLLSGSIGAHSTTVLRAAASLVNGSADLRRALSFLSLKTCCLASISDAVTTIASCTALTELCFFWSGHENDDDDDDEGVAPSDMLAPLSALRMLGALSYGHGHEHQQGMQPLPAAAMLAPLPALPDAPRLTRLSLGMLGNFVPVGSDAALGRLRRLEFVHQAPVLDTEDPFLLRAAFDAGTWQPSRLTGLRELKFTLGPVSARAPARPLQPGSRAGSEWAPLAGQVTALFVRVTARRFLVPEEYDRPSTGIVAGLGVLTALRDLSIKADEEFDEEFSSLSFDLGLHELASIDRVRAPCLTRLSNDCVSAPVNVARFPNLVHLSLRSTSHQPPLNLRSLVARSSLKTLELWRTLDFLHLTCLINLAELFVGGNGWPVLETLGLVDIMLEWDTTGLAGAPTAAEFAGRARQLLPALVDVEIEETTGPNAPPEPRAAFVVACRQHVVPALRGLHAGEG